MGAWQTAWIAAGTAAVVTLAVEYAAKPALEVRKDRIVAQARAYRRLQSDLRHVFVLIGGWPMKNIPAELVAENLLAVRGQLADIRQQLTEIDIERIPDNFRGPFALVLGRYDAACVNGLQASAGGLSDHLLDALTMPVEYSDALTALSDYLLTPRTKSIGRIYHRRQARAALRALADAD